MPDTIEEIFSFLSTHFKAASMLIGGPDFSRIAPAVVFIATIPMPACLAFAITEFKDSILEVL